MVQNRQAFSSNTALMLGSEPMTHDQRRAARRQLAPWAGAVVDTAPQPHGTYGSSRGVPAVKPRDHAAPVTPTLHSPASRKLWAPGRSSWASSAPLQGYLVRDHHPLYCPREANTLEQTAEPQTARLRSDHHHTAGQGHSLSCLSPRLGYTRHTHQKRLHPPISPQEKYGFHTCTFFNSEREQVFLSEVANGNLHLYSKCHSSHHSATC